MKKDVLINIKGIQRAGGEQDVTELFTQGSLYKRNNSYYVTYSESEATGYADSHTTLKVDSKNRVILIRSGAVRSHLVIMPGERNIGHYGTEGGDLMIGVDAKAVRSTLGEDGGDLYFSYTLDVNSSFLSRNRSVYQYKRNGAVMHSVQKFIRQAPVIIKCRTEKQI